MQDPISTGSGGQAETTPPANAGQAPDLASIKVRVGDGPDAEMSVADLAEAYKEARKEMHQAIQDKHETKRQYKWADTFEHDLETDPDLRGHIESYYAPQAPTQQVQYDRYGEPIAGSHNVQHQAYRQSAVPSRERIKLDQIETKLHVLSQREAMGDLTRDLKESFGYSLSDKQRAAILEHIESTGNENVNDIFWGKFGKDVVKNSASKEKKETVEKLKGNAAAYTGAPSGLSGVTSVDVASMGEGDYENHKLKVIADIMRKGGG